uniref:WASH_WAHD domain-containing protein n=1 Tax=Panagrellus redivivus TaxID=6233 RepID=A0A7E4ZPV9_PANRE
MNCGSIQLSVQRQLKENWDDREYIQLISDHIKNTADFLTKFEVSVKSKLAELDDTITCLERRLDYLEALTVAMIVLVVKPCSKHGWSCFSCHQGRRRGCVPLRCPHRFHLEDRGSPQCPRRLQGIFILRTPSVFSIDCSGFGCSTLFERVFCRFFRGQRLAPKFWHDYDLKDMPLPVFRAVLKKQFTKNAHLNDVRVIDRQVGETKQHIYSINYNFYNKDHVRNFLFRENVEAKPKDFLSRFLSQKE